jgi:hypothetical protein
MKPTSEGRKRKSGGEFPYLILNRRRFFEMMSVAINHGAGTVICKCTYFERE